MATLADTWQGKPVDDHRPWPRLLVTPDAWERRERAC